MMKDPNTRLISAFILGIIVGIGGLWLWQNRAIPVDDISDEDLSASSTASTVFEVEAPGTSVAVQNQIIRVENQPPSFVVVVAQVTLEKPTWVVIHDNENGKPGKILGARLFDKGKTSGIVDLIRATESGRSYIAMLHTYSGVKRLFDSKLDTPTLDTNGKFIETVFSAIKSAN